MKRIDAIESEHGAAIEPAVRRIDLGNRMHRFASAAAVVGSVPDPAAAEPTKPQAPPETADCTSCRGSGRKAYMSDGDRMRTWRMTPCWTCRPTASDLHVTPKGLRRKDADGLKAAADARGKGA